MPATNTRIDQRFSAMKRAGEKGFVAYITAGDPSLAATRDRVLRLEEAGVDLVELGIPFSDPLADGTVNQHSAERALAAGATLDGVFETIAAVREKSNIPLLCYSYMNPLYAKGFERSAKAAAAAGLDGLLVLDLPVEEAAPYTHILHATNLNAIQLVTPTSGLSRIRKIVREASGFVYCVSREGVTGVQKKVNTDAHQVVRDIKRCTQLPVAMGFGVATPRQAREAVKEADAVVVGSAIVERFHKAPRNAAGQRATAQWVGRLVRAVKKENAS